jgi:hypothetical protein
MGSRFWPNSLGGQTFSDLADPVASGLRDWSCVGEWCGRQTRCVQNRLRALRIQGSCRQASRASSINGAPSECW